MYNDKVEKPVRRACNGHGKRTTGQFVDDEVICLPTSGFEACRHCALYRGLLKTAFTSLLA